ncbi:pheromone A receptor-domain-containing protein [Schizophyllum amplum]|uniref:Pheromone A receptor-domain-containing protein n=1 Tax=Schizophyllum amplum TaxID=97359 RepID=A0A550CY15_9AGAR|nr:pheromone A receptor-domain-containing protein [Auriculariopsis ampla]
MSAANIAYAIFAFVTFLLVLVPLPWHLQAWNSGVCIYIVWIAVGCLILYVDAVVWNDSVGDPLPGWCDFSGRIMVAVPYGVEAATLCIHRRLYHICRASDVSSKTSKRRWVVVDILIAVVLPCILMGLQYIVQGHRYDIYENYGCMLNTYLTGPAILILRGPPIILGVISGVYCVLLIRIFARRRQRADMTTPLSRGICLRLIMLSVATLLFTVSLNLYTLVESTRYGIATWVSWDDTHFDFWRVEAYKDDVWRAAPGAAGLEVSRWMLVIAGLAIFAFFGLGEEARKHYRSAFQQAKAELASLRRFCRSTSSSSITHLRRRPAHDDKFLRDDTLTISRHIESIAQSSTKTLCVSQPSMEEHKSVDLSYLRVGLLTPKFDVDPEKPLPATPRASSRMSAIPEVLVENSRTPTPTQERDGPREGLVPPMSVHSMFSRAAPSTAPSIYSQASMPDLSRHYYRAQSSPPPVPAPDTSRSSQSFLEILTPIPEAHLRVDPPNYSDPTSV